MEIVSPLLCTIMFLFIPGAKFSYLLSAYLVLWDEVILEAIMNPGSALGKKAKRDLLNLQKPKVTSSVEKSSKLDGPYRKDWLKTAQNDMINIEKLRLSSQLVGKLYGLVMSNSKEPNDHWDIYNPDSIAFAKAYKDAMVRSSFQVGFVHVSTLTSDLFIQDVQKHGGSVCLPNHLREKLPSKDQSFWRKVEDIGILSFKRC